MEGASVEKGRGEVMERHQHSSSLPSSLSSYCSLFSFPYRLLLPSVSPTLFPPPIPHLLSFAPFLSTQPPLFSQTFHPNFTSFPPSHVLFVMGWFSPLYAPHPSSPSFFSFLSLPYVLPPAFLIKPVPSPSLGTKTFI